MISPADEIVCLSYGRVIYIPSSPHQLTKPIRTSLSTGSYTSYPSVPSTSSSTKSEPILLNNYSESPPIKPERKKKIAKTPDRLSVPESVSSKGKSKSLRNFDLDFDLLFNRETSPGKLSVKSWNFGQETGPRLSGKISTSGENGFKSN